MDWINNIIIPSIMLIIYSIIIGGIAFIIIRFLLRLWKQKIKFILRYSLLHTKYDEIIIKECYDAIEKKWNNYEFKMHLLKNDFSWDEIYELMFIYDKIKSEIGFNELKGGFKRK